ncbi:hypothetical protein ACK3SF_00725 [Candidatus Nanosalina sp. VS9-1]|uniref:hypothetical protein n=1 Tax=Candidatus Nanosalina sp. VS9-1 TaxID=3388566 RepID=UPI0039E146C8
MIQSFLSAADKTDIQVLSESDLEQARRRGDFERPLFFYETDSRVEVYESNPRLGEILHPFNSTHDYFLRVDPSYTHEAYFSATEQDLKEITDTLSSIVENSDEAYMKIVQDF